jgi:hypothetical protein
VAVYLLFVWLFPFDGQVVFAGLSIGFAIACARIVVQQSRDAVRVAREDESFMFGDGQRQP